MLFVLIRGCSTELSGGRVEISMFYADFVEGNKMNREIIGNFEKIRPTIRVRLITGEDAKRLTMIAADIPADIMPVDPEELSFYASKGLLMPLERFTSTDPGFRLSGYFANMVAMCRYQGALYSLPSTFSPVAIYYNRDLFDEAGVGYPDETWDWDKFVAAARKLTRDRDGDGRTDQYGFAVSWWRNRWPIWIWQNGGDVFNEAGDRCIIDRPEAIAGLSFYSDLVTRHHVSPGYGAQMAGVKGQDSGEWFVAGRIAMTAESRYMHTRFQNITGFKWDVGPLPKQRRRATTFVGGTMAISAKTPHPQEAWEFLKYFTGEGGSSVYMRGGRALSGYRPTAERAVVHPGQPPEHDHVFIDAVDYCFRPPYSAEHIRAWARAEEQLQLIPQGRVQVAEACRSFARIFNEYFAELRQKHPEGGAKRP
jgi:multiple sugar transport system substrate-binding protein